MSPSVCIRCALRLRIAESRGSTLTKRTFSATSSKRRAIGPLPKFTPTSQPELDNVLASLRYKHFLPIALSNNERNLIHKPKYKQQLLDQPEVVTIGDEDITLEHIDRLTDVPSLQRELIPKAIAMMAKGESSDWNQLPALLIGLKKAKLTPSDRIMCKIVRKAIGSDRFGVVLQCLQQASLTGMQLTSDGVLSHVLAALRQIAMDDNWSEEATSKAIRDANEIAVLLEDDIHRRSRFAIPADPRDSTSDARARPEVLAVFLELSAIYAMKFTGGKDADGKVTSYAARMLNNMEAIKTDEAANSKLDERAVLKKARIRPNSSIRSTGPQWDILQGVPIYHGLILAQKILSSDMPRPELAQQVVNNYSTGLAKLVQELKPKLTRSIRRPLAKGETAVEGGRVNLEKGVVWFKEPKLGTYPRSAMSVWESRLPIDDEAKWAEVMREEEEKKAAKLQEQTADQSTEAAA